MVSVQNGTVQAFCFVVVSEHVFFRTIVHAMPVTNFLRTFAILKGKITLHYNLSVDSWNRRANISLKHKYLHAFTHAHTRSLEEL